MHKKFRVQTIVERVNIFRSTQWQELAVAIGDENFLKSSQIPVYSSVFNVTGSSSNFKNLSSNKSRQGEDVTINGNNEPQTLYP